MNYHGVPVSFYGMEPWDTTVPEAPGPSSHSSTPHHLGPPPQNVDVPSILAQSRKRLTTRRGPRAT